MLIQKPHVPPSQLREVEDKVRRKISNKIIRIAFAW